MKVGLISDTHAPQRCHELPKGIFRAFDGVDLILHAGDVGELWVLEQLSETAPVVAVHGNDEVADAPDVLPYLAVMQIAGHRVALCHGHRPDPDEERESRTIDDWHTMLAWRRGLAPTADVIVYGHLHVPLAGEVDGALLVNPGAIAPGNLIVRQTVRSVALLDLDDRRVVHVDVDTGEEFAPDVDLSAGYWASAQAFQQPIVPPAMWDDYRTWWRGLRETAGPSESFQAILRVAQRVWWGDLEEMTAELILAELASVVDADVLSECERVFSP